jgi:hypothetical protein
MRRCTGFSPSPMNGAIEHDVHRVVEVGALGVILERDLFVVGLHVHVVSIVRWQVLQSGIVPQNRAASIRPRGKR